MNFITLFSFFYIIANVLSTCQHGYEQVSSLTLNSTIYPKICDACVSYTLKGSKDSSGAYTSLDFKCILDGVMECYGSTLNMEYTNGSAENFCSIPTDNSMFGDKQFATDYIEQLYPPGTYIDICATNNNDCMFTTPTSSATKLTINLLVVIALNLFMFQLL
jgi:hypothetical protein